MKNFYEKDKVFSEIKRITEQVSNAKNIIVDVDDNELDKTAIELLNFLIDNGMTFERAGGYWKNQSYWYVKYNNEFVCYILCPDPLCTVSDPHTDLIASFFALHRCKTYL